MSNSLMQELRYGFRSLLSRPAFLVAAVLTLALGIGANTAIFSVVNGLLLQPLPYPDGERLVNVHNAYPKMGLDYAGTSIPDYFDRRSQAPALEDLAIYTGASLNLASEGVPQRVVGLMASASLFSTLGARPLLGRVFDESAEVPGNDQQVVLSHGLWTQQFGADRDIIGRDVRLNGKPYRVTAVMPASFVFPNRDTQAWIPFAFTPAQKLDDGRGNEFSESIGRLAPGASIEQLEAQFAAIVRRNAERIAGLDDPRAANFAEFLRNGSFEGQAVPLRERWVGDVRPVLILLQAVVGFVLLIACANVANLMLTRVSARQKELAVRSAIGASRRRILRQLLIEALIVAILGAVVGIVVAHLALQLLDALGLTDTPLRSAVGIDATVLTFTLLVSVGTGLVFGLLPALAQGAGRSFDALKEGGRGNTDGRASRATRNVLVVAQIALCVSLLVGAGLLIRSFDRVQHEDPGFRSEGLVTLRLELPEHRYGDTPAIADFHRRALAGLRAVPGVSEAAFVSTLPFGDGNWQSSYWVEGRELPQGEPMPHGMLRIADEAYFDLMDIPLLLGRGFRASDAAGSEPVVVVDELLAKRWFPGENPVGRRIRPGGSQDDAENPWRTIVGVVGTVKQADLASEVTKETYYFPLQQFPLAERGARGGYYAVRTALLGGGMVEPIRQALLQVDPEQPVYDIRSLDDRIALSLQGRRAPMLLLVLFAGVALALSAVGIYGVLAYAVEQRTGELGVRLAIGAQRGDVVRMVLGQGGRTVAIGLGLGLIGALALGGFLGAHLFGVSRFDPTTFAAVALLLGGVALFACWVPALRAARVQPIVALRHE